MNKLEWLNAQEERLNSALEENQRRRKFLENELQVIRELKQEEEREIDFKNVFSNISTRDLVEELKLREAVETHLAEPYKTETISVDGPAIVLAITD